MILDYNAHANTYFDEKMTEEEKEIWRRQHREAVGPWLTIPWELQVCLLASFLFVLQNITDFDTFLKVFPIAGSETRKRLRANIEDSPLPHIQKKLRIQRPLTNYPKDLAPLELYRFLQLRLLQFGVRGSVKEALNVDALRVKRWMWDHSQFGIYPRQDLEKFHSENLEFFTWEYFCAFLAIAEACEIPQLIETMKGIKILAVEKGVDLGAPLPAVPQLLPFHQQRKTIEDSRRLAAPLNDFVDAMDIDESPDPSRSNRNAPNGEAANSSAPYGANKKEGEPGCTQNSDTSAAPSCTLA